MDKHTLSNYGFVLVATIIVAALLAVLSPLTPFGDYVRSSINEVVDNYMEKTDIEDVDNKQDNVNPVPNGDNVQRKVTINLLYEDGKQIQAPIVINVSHGEKVNIKSKIPNIEGYTTINIPKEEAIIKDTEYNIIYTKNSYSITYETNGGTIVSAKPTSYMYSEIVELPTKVVKEGTYFAGWYLNSDFSGNRIYKIDSNIKGDITLYARWERNAFNVKYISNGTELTFDEQYMKVFYGESIVLPVMDAKNGLNFGGWYTNQYFSGGNVTQTPQYPEADLVYYAYWTSEGFSITYETNGGTFTGTVPRTYTTGQKVALPTCVEKAGYVLEGWYAESTLKTKVTEIKTSDFGNKHFYAKWTPATYNISYDLVGGTATGTLSATYTFNPNSSPLTYNTAVSKPGYTFVGWKDVDLGTIETGVGRGRYGNITLIAQYTTKAYEITYDANGGVPESTTVAIRYNNEYGTGPTVTKIGHEFDGWYTEKTGGTKITATTRFTRTSNQTLYAHWKYATYEIEYIENGGTFKTTPTKQYTFATGLTLPTNIERTNYDFAGWYTDSTLTTKITSISTTTYGKVTVYAKWTPKKFNISFDANGGSLSETPPTQYTYGTGINPLPIPTKSGYNFIGWKDGSGNIVDIISSTDSGNKTLTAQWIAKELSVDLVLVDSSGNTILNSENSAYKVTIIPQYNQTYTFSDTEVINTFNLQETYYHPSFSLKYTESQAIANDFHITYNVVCYTYRTLNVELYYDNVKQLLDNEGSSNFNATYKFRQSAHETAQLEIPEFIDNQAYQLDNNGLGGKTVEQYVGNGGNTLRIYYKAYKFAIVFEYDSSMTPTSTLPTEYCYGQIPFTVPVFTRDCYVFDGYEVTNGTSSGSGNTRSITPSAPGVVKLKPKWVLSTVASAHSMTSVVTKTAYCNATGVRTYTCQDGCGYSYTETINKNASNHANTTSFDWGGTASVHQKYKCCGATYSTSHSYTASTQTAATCTSTGVRKQSCACGYYYTETIAKTSHSQTTGGSIITYVNCTTNGTRYYKCSVCQANLSSSYVYEYAWNHNYTDVTAAYSSTMSNGRSWCYFTEQYLECSNGSCAATTTNLVYGPSHGNATTKFNAVANQKRWYYKAGYSGSYVVKTETSESQQTIIYYSTSASEPNSNMTNSEKSFAFKSSFTAAYTTCTNRRGTYNKTALGFCAKSNTLHNTTYYCYGPIAYSSTTDSQGNLTWGRTE